MRGESNRTASTVLIKVDDSASSAWAFASATLSRLSAVANDFRMFRWEDEWSALERSDRETRSHFTL